MKITEKVKTLKSSDVDDSEVNPSAKDVISVDTVNTVNTVKPVEIVRVDESKVDERVLDVSKSPEIIGQPPQPKKRRKRKHTKKSILNVPKVNIPSVHKVDKKPIGFKIGLVVGVVLGGLGLYFLILKLRELSKKHEPPDEPRENNKTVGVGVNNAELPRDFNLSGY